METSNFLFWAIIQWKLNRMDALTLARCFLNAGSQYIAIVIASSVGTPSHVGPRLILEPIRGIVTGIHYVLLAETVFERN